MTGLDEGRGFGEELSAFVRCGVERGLSLQSRNTQGHLSPVTMIVQSHSIKKKKKIKVTARSI